MIWGHHDAFNGIDMTNISVSNGITKSAYEGHYDFPNLCNCKYTRPIIAGDWVEKKMLPSIHTLPTYLNTNKKWTFAVYNCVCSHKFIDLIKYVKNSGLSYWDQVMLVNSLVNDIFSLYPNGNIYNLPRYFGRQNSLKKYSFLKMFPPLLQQDQLYPHHLIKCMEDYNYWKECISQYKRVVQNNPAQYSYGKFEKLIFEFCVDVTVHHIRLVMKY